MFPILAPSLSVPPFGHCFSVCVCFLFFQLCSNDLLDGVEELMDGISLLPEPDKTLPAHEAEPQQNANQGEEEGEAQAPAWAMGPVVHVRESCLAEIVPAMV